MTPLAAILATLFAFAPVRAEQLAAHTTSAARQHGVEVAWFAATLAHESSYETTARNRRTGAIGVGQLLWPNYVRGYRKDCWRHPLDCEYAQFRWSAVALRESIAVCRGSYTRALAHYRGEGGCRYTFNARQTRLLAAMIRERLASPSSEPMSLPRLRVSRAGEVR